MSTIDTPTGMLLGGDLHVSIQDEAGAFGPWQHVECNELTITPAVEMKEEVSRGRSAAYGQPHTSIPVPGANAFSARFTKHSREIMAMSLNGVVTAESAAADSLTDVEVTVPAYGWAEIGAEGVTDVVVKSGTAPDTVTHVENVDYFLNPRLGMISRVIGGNLPVNGEVSVSATVPARTSYVIEGNSRPRTVMRWKFDGENRANNRDLILWSDRVVVSSTEARNFLDTEIMGFPLTGKFEIAPGATAPYYLRYL